MDRMLAYLGLTIASLKQSTIIVKWMSSLATDVLCVSEILFIFTSPVCIVQSAEIAVICAAVS